MPDAFASNATLTQISSRVNSTEYEIIYRCQNCFSWSKGDYNESNPTSSPTWPFLLGWAQASRGPLESRLPDQITFDFHDLGYTQWVADPQRHECFLPEMGCLGNYDTSRRLVPQGHYGLFTYDDADRVTVRNNSGSFGGWWSIRSMDGRGMAGCG